MLSDQPKRLLPVSPAARVYQQEMGACLRDLNACSEEIISSQEQRTVWHRFLMLLERYQETIAVDSSLTVTCSAGCAAGHACCCNHWVDDVYSFEIALLADYLRRHHADLIAEIVKKCREDIALFERLKSMTEAKLDGQKTPDIDATDLACAVFYQMKKPCPLLDGSRCIAYEFRPLICRRYVSFSSPDSCLPEAINEGEPPTYLFGIDEKADFRLEALHHRNMRFEGETALRPMLLRYLSDRESF